MTFKDDTKEKVNEIINIKNPYSIEHVLLVGGLKYN